MFQFENLIVWQKSIDYADRIYDLTDRFPRDEKFGLTAQLRRAAVSISSNIAEGDGRTSKTDHARFIEIAYGSLMETISQVTLAARRQWLSDDELAKLRHAAEEIARMLSGLRRSILAPSNKQ
ncbi:four helix bundle protein [Stratiformator vulcanicus]|uniref:Four helix bundle protein n=1 Tax=Stratiformator vulcanicus TaxID=2527980 RepID=A0A517R0A8_9PLAN|nr:four helix bundle protein [Stratiformator vulcanicus]QDT37337.1 hypothetical protein Pan189_17100 [Stratiformator vulcanicus]